MNSQEYNNSRLGWTKQEEEYLRQLYQINSQRSWKQISKKINQKFLTIKRTPKQCRQRYTNYIKFTKEIKEQKPWSQEDDVQLFHKYMEVGSKWVQICKTISDRSENFLKNRFYGSLRKVLRRINKVQKLNKMKKYKPIKFDSLLKVLESSYHTSNDVYIDPILKISYQNFIEKLKSDILQLAIKIQNSISDEQILELIDRTHKFNSVTRFFNITKQRKSKTLKRRTLPPIKKITKMQSTQQQNPFLQNQEIVKNKIQIEDLPEQLREQFKYILQNMQNCFESKKNSKDLEQELNIILDRNANVDMGSLNYFQHS